MRAIVQQAYGSADVLELRDIDPPTIGADEVLVRVRAAGVDRGVWHLMTGLPYPVRLAGYGVRAPKQPVPGMDLAGVVEAVGSAVTRFTPGDEVFGVGTGTFAELARASEAKLAHKPADLEWAEAGALGISALTALQALRDTGSVQAGQRVLVIGASGGVGSYAVQVAKALGAEVTGVCSPGKVDLVRSLGADHVLDYTAQDFADGSVQYDLIIDIGGNTTLRRLRAALTPTGTAAIVGGENGGRFLGGFDRMLRAPVLSMMVGQRLAAVACSENAADLEVLAGMATAGQVRAAVERTFPLDQAPDAIRHLQGGHARGKLVVTV